MRFDFQCRGDFDEGSYGGNVYLRFKFNALPEFIRNAGLLGGLFLGKAKP